MQFKAINCNLFIRFFFSGELLKRFLHVFFWFRVWLQIAFVIKLNWSLSFLCSCYGAFNGMTSSRGRKEGEVGIKLHLKFSWVHKRLSDYWVLNLRFILRKIQLEAEQTMISRLRSVSVLVANLDIILSSLKKYCELPVETSEEYFATRSSTQIRLFFCVCFGEVQNIKRALIPQRISFSVWCWD